MKKNVIVGQSGGPTAVINASLYGVVYEASEPRRNTWHCLWYDKWNRRISE